MLQPKNHPAGATAIAPAKRMLLNTKQMLVAMAIALCFFGLNVFGQSIPTITVSGTGTYNTNGGNAVPIAPNAVLTDPGNAGLTGVSISFDSNFVSGQDYLSFTPMNGITGSFNPNSGVMILSGAASAANYQAAIRSVLYSNSFQTTASRKKITISLGAALYNQYNSHFYQVVNAPNGISWTDAAAAAQTSTLFGMQGYLVTVTAQQENDFISQRVPQNSWIGASDAASEGIWRWVTGPEGLESSGQGRYFCAQHLLPSFCSANTGTSVGGNFINWNGGEPNNCGGNENYAHMIGGSGYWNDLPNSAGVDAYIIEYGGMPGDPSINVSGDVYVDVVYAPATVISDINLSPQSLLEGLPVGTAVGTFSTIASDPNDTTFTYSLVAGGGDADNASFIISNNQLLTASIFSYNTQNTYNVRIASTDGSGNIFVKPFTIAVTQLPPAISDFSVGVPENQTYNFTTGNFSDVFVDHSGSGFAYIQISSLPSNGTLSLWGSPVNIGDQVYVWDINSLSYAAYNNYVGTDVFQWYAFNWNGTETATAANANINVVIGNPPTSISLDNTNIFDFQPIGTLVGNLSATDPDPNETFTYTLADNYDYGDNVHFAIIGNQLQTSEILNGTNQNSYWINVQVTDAEGLTYQQQFGINVTHTLTIADFSVNDLENQTYGFSDTQFSNVFTDNGGPSFYMIQIQSLPTSGSLQLYGNPVNVGDQIYTWDISSMTYAPNNNFTGTDAFQWTGMDDWGYWSNNTATVTINVNAPAVPTDITITTTDINELQPAGTAVGFLSTTDLDSTATFTYTLVPGVGDDDNASFSIFLNKLQAQSSFDYAVKNTYNVRIATTDGSGASFEKAFVINVKHLLPVLANFGNSVIQGDTLTFAATDFTNNYSVPDNLPMTHVIITSLPSSGELDLYGVPVSAGDFISTTDLAYLTYAADPNFTGDVTFTWNVHDGVGFRADNDGEDDIHVAKKHIIIGYTDITDNNGGSPSGSGASGRILIPNGNMTHVGPVASGSGASRDTTVTDPNSLGGRHKTDGIAQSAQLPIASKCFPNPFAENIIIQYQIPVDAKVVLKVYNLLGMEVANLVEANQTAGAYQINWSGKSNEGLPAETGNYFYKVTLIDNNGSIIGSVNGRMVKM